MIFHSKVLYAARVTRAVELIACALPCLFFSEGARGAEYTRNSFPLSGDGVADSNLVAENGATVLGVSYTAMSKVFGDNTPSSPASAVTFFPDVAPTGDGTFAFFWADSQGIYRREYGMQGGGAAPLAAPVRIAEIVPGNACYLHSDKGENGWLASYVAVDGAVRRVQACNGSARYDLDSTSSIFCYASQCVAEKDTYCIAYITNLESLTVAKVYSRGTEIRKIASAAVAAGAPVNGQALVNPSVAADGGGAILVSWAKGGLQVPKDLYCRFFDRDLRPIGDETRLATNICQRDTMHYYDCAPILSWRSGRFALASWDSAGVLLHTVRLNGASVTASSARIANRPNVRSTAIAAWRKYLAVACKGDLDNDGNRGVEGLRFAIKDNEPDMQNGEFFRFSDASVPDTTKDRFSASLNCAFDSTGNMALAWRHGAHVKLCLWSKKGIRFPRGFWMSPVESLSVSAADSTRLYPGTAAVSDLSSWYVEDSVRIGRSPSDFSASKPWTSLSNEAALAALAGKNRFFQFRVTLNRKPLADSIATPVLQAITVPWNAKPLFSAVDSLEVNKQPLPDMQFGDTVTLVSRYDSLIAYLRLRDADSTGRLTLRATWPAADSLLSCASGPRAGAQIRFSRIPWSDTALTCTLTAVDSLGWEADPAFVHLHTRNSPPRLLVKVVYRAPDGTPDTASLSSDSRFGVQEDDSIVVLYSVADTNDSATAKAYLYSAAAGVETLLDSAAGGAEKRFAVYGSGLPPSDSLTVSAAGRDPDTSVWRRVTLVVNHLPRIVAVTVDGKAVHGGDTVRVAIGRRADIAVTAADADLAFWDTLQCSFVTREKRDSVKQKNPLFGYGLLPGRADTLVDIIVRDLCGRADSMRLYLKYPWLAIDSASNPAYAKALDSLDTALSLIIGSNDTGSVAVPLINTGCDTMHLTSLHLPAQTNRWLSVGIPQGDVVVRFSAATAQQFEPVLLQPGEATRCVVYVNADSCRGDSVVWGRCIFGTSDYAHQSDTVPVRLEYNDLPRIVKVAPDWDSTKPYTPGGTGKKRRPVKYRFPPHAAIGIDFSEPVDSASAQRGLRVYSVFDSSASGTVRPIHVLHAWSANRTRLLLRADYKAESPHFKTMPPPGLFIPTDSIAIEVTPALTDLASTPLGPNGLDIDNDCNYDTGGSARYPMRLDSITFRLLSARPAGGDTGVAPGTFLTLTFSAPVLPSSIDTSRAGNRSLTVTSRCSAGEPIPFDSVRIKGAAVCFYPGTRLFYNDSVSCRFRGVSIRDSMGFPSDNTGDGIPLSLFDTLAGGEDVEWRFRVKGISVLSAGPNGNDTVSQAARPVVLRFSDTVPPGAFDTTLSGGNRSFTIRSLYGGQALSVFRSIEFSPDGSVITVTTGHGYFSGDSIHCRFAGFSGKYRYGAADNLPQGGSDCFSGFEWTFRVGSTAFYVYPNPYKPGKDPRHCRESGPCGIWFKNLHMLAKETEGYRICIYSMKALPLYDTKKAGLALHFKPGDEPQWLWKTTNQSGEKVGSGVYFYAVFDTKDKALVKGKLMIVR